MANSCLKSLLVLLASFVLWSSPIFEASAQEPQQVGASVGKHGLQEVLAEQLIRDRDSEALLRLADSFIERAEADFNVDPLLRIFGLPYDLFHFDKDTGTAFSLRDHAHSILLKSPPTIQRRWSQANRVFAEQEMQAALRSGRPTEIARVARHFPFTEAGIRAEVVALSCQLLKGEVTNLDLGIRHLESQYAGTVLQAELQQKLRPLRSMLREVQLRQEVVAGGTRESDTKLSVATAEAAGTVSPPWPKPLWIWRESIWNYPGVLQPEAGSALESYAPESDQRFRSFNNWRSVFWGGYLVVRTPFRIIALNRATGQEQWSVPTDTFERQEDRLLDEVESATRREMALSRFASNGALPIEGLAEFGLVASDDDFLFFVDRFRFFGMEDPFSANQTGRVIRQRNGFPIIEDNEDFSSNSVGTRLVALRRSVHDSVPTVAWRIGDRQDFSYIPAAPGSSIVAEAIEASAPVSSKFGGDFPNAEVQIAVVEDTMAADSVAADPWSGHRFLSPPTGNGNRLYVLSSRDTEVFLNCLERNTGELVWRQPLIYSDVSTVTYADRSIFAKRASTCVVSGDTVVCNLSDGVITGVHALDGTLRWATAIRDEPAAIMPQFRFGARLLADETTIESPAIMVPCISGGVVVCSTHGSVSLYGLSLETGEILWKASRRAFGAGDVGGSPDYYVAGLSGDQIILAGDRHLRSVNLHKGTQNWVVETPGVSGRAECRGDRCIIPVFSGQAVTVDLSAGKAIPRSTLPAPAGSIHQYGAVVSDDELICLSSPTCVAAYSRVDSLLRNADQIPSLAANPGKRVLIQAQAHLINDNPTASMQLLRDHIAARDQNAAVEAEPQVDTFLAELVLQQWGRRIASQLESLPADGADSTDTLLEVVPSEAELLRSLNLAGELKFRTEAFGLLAEPSESRSSSTVLAKLRRDRAWKLPIALTESWSLQPGLLFDQPDNAMPIDAVRLKDLAREELKYIVSDFLQNSKSIPDEPTRSALAERLLKLHEFPVAEVFLAKWSQSERQVGRESSADQPLEFLRHMRSRRGESEPPQQSVPQRGDEVVPLNHGLTSAVVTPLAFDSSMCIRQSDQEMEARMQGIELNMIPPQRGLNTFVVNDNDGKSTLMAFHQGDGTLRDRLVLPFRFNQTEQYVALSKGDKVPSLFPVCGIWDMAMIACSDCNSLNMLWNKRISNDQQNAALVEFGPLGADHFVWHSDGVLHCTNPLTGHDLWTRNLSLSQNEQAMMYRGTNPSVRRIVGDHIATVVMGSDSRSFERFNTRDGRMLGRGRLDIGRSESVVTIGRCLMYTDANSRLHLFDGATGQDELADDDPIVLRSNLEGKTLCEVLDDNYVLAVSATLELILIDTNKGEVIFRTPAAQHVSTGSVFSFSAFVRNGHLFAALSEQVGGARDLERSFIRRSPRLSKGPLICMDPATGSVNWVLPMNGGVLPEIHGDPTDLLVSWSLLEQPFDANMRFQRTDRLSIQVIDSATGQLIAVAPVCSSLPPLRCVHIASEQRILLTTPNATISIYASKDDNTAYP